MKTALLTTLGLVCLLVCTRGPQLGGDLPPYRLTGRIVDGLESGGRNYYQVQIEAISGKTFAVWATSPHRQTIGRLVELRCRNIRGRRQPFGGHAFYQSYRIVD